jgi:hypothetical protein
MTDHIVTLPHLGNTFYLRSTVWTSERDRATVFKSQEAAQAGLQDAKQFMKAKQFKAAHIEAVPTIVISGNGGVTDKGNRVGMPISTAENVGSSTWKRPTTKLDDIDPV